MTEDSIDVAAPMKRCCTCKVEKSLAQFHKDRGREDGLDQRCKDCRREQGRIQRAQQRAKREVEKAVAAQAFMDGGVKTCVDCGVEKPFADFAWANKAKGILYTYCRECQSVRNADYHARNSERLKAERRAVAALRAPIPVLCNRCNEEMPIIYRKGKKRWCEDCYVGWRQEQDALAFARDRSDDSGKRSLPCSRCGQDKPHAAFAFSTPEKKIRHTWCRDCYREYNRERYVTLDLNSQEKERRKADPEKYRAKSQAGNESLSVWEKRRYNSLQRARRMGAPIIYYTAEQLEAKWDLWGHKCWMCGGDADTHEHVKPLAAGGWECLANFRPSCDVCNGRKIGHWPFPTSTKCDPFDVFNGFVEENEVGKHSVLDDYV